MPAYRYMIRTKGTVELGVDSCAQCHTRVMPDGSILKGAQSNSPVQRAAAYGLRANGAKGKDSDQLLADTRGLLKMLHATPWLRPDPNDRIDTMSIDEIASAFESIPPVLVFAREAVPSCQSRYPT